MSKKKRKHIVYSTNPDFEFDYESADENETLPPHQQDLRVRIDRKNRNGKSVTLVNGFIGTEEDLKTLAKQLKSACGVGGSIKDGEIVLQGEWTDKVVSQLQASGYKCKKSGG
jgi:translation initiation factor 1